MRRFEFRIILGAFEIVHALRLVVRDANSIARYHPNCSHWLPPCFESAKAWRILAC